MAPGAHRHFAVFSLIGIVLLNIYHWSWASTHSAATPLSFSAATSGGKALFAIAIGATLLAWLFSLLHAFRQRAYVWAACIAIFWPALYLYAWFDRPSKPVG